MLDLELGEIVSSIIIMIILLWGLFEFYQIKKIFKVLKLDFDAAINIINFKDNHRVNFFNRFEEINKALSGIKTYGHSWKEFSEHLIKPDEFIDEELVIKNSILPEVFFSQDIVVYENIDQKHYDAIPGYLTGLGVLGTFIGFMIGLWSLDPSNLNQEAIGSLLQGAKTAFMTSIAGVAGSILFSLSEKRHIKKLNKKANDFIDSLEISLKFTTSEQLTIETNKKLNEISQNSDAFINNFVTALEQSLSQLLETHIGSNANNIIGALNGIKDIQENGQKEMLESIADQLSGGLRETATEAQQGATQQFETITQNLNEAFTQMMSAQEQQRNHSQTLMEQMNQQNSSFSQDIQSQMRAILENVNQTGHDATQKLQEDLQNVVRGLSEESKRSGEEFAGKLNQQVNEVSEILDQASNRFVLANNNLADKVDMSANRYSEGSQKILTSSEVFRTTVGNLSSSLTEMQQITTRQATMTGSQNNIINELKEYSESLNRLVVALSAQSETSEDLNRALREQVIGIQENSNNIRQIWEEYRSRFAEVDQSLEGAFNNIVQGNQNFSQEAQNFMTELAGKISVILERLSELIEELPEFSQSNQ